MKPKIVDAIGIGVSKKKAHIFSTKRPLDLVPAKANAPKIDNKEAMNNKIDVTLHLFRMGSSTVLDGFLYIYE